MGTGVGDMGSGWAGPFGPKEFSASGDGRAGGGPRRTLQNAGPTVQPQVPGAGGDTLLVSAMVPARHGPNKPGLNK